MNHRTRNVLAGLAVTTAAVLTISGCASSPEPTTPIDPEAPDAALEVTDIALGILPTPGYAPMQIALDQGFFDEEGFTSVDIQISNSQTILPNLLNQTFHATGYNTIMFVQSIHEDLPIKVISELERGGPGYAGILVAADSPYQSLADLDGKKFAAVNTPGNCDLIPIAKLLAEGSDAEPEFVQLAIPEMAGQLQRGGIDAACVPEPARTAMLASGDFREIDDLFSGAYDGFPIAVYAVSAAFAESNPNTIAAIQRAIDKARAFAAENPEAVRDAMTRYTQLPPEAIEAMVLPTFMVENDFDALQQVVDLLRSTNVLPDAELSGDYVFTR